MQLFCLQLKASCLQWSFSYSQLANLAFLLSRVGVFCLQFKLSYLQLELFGLQWESASNKGLKGLQVEKLN